MADLEEREHREALAQLGTQAREGLVGEEDIPLDLLRDLINCARIAQSQRSSSLLKGPVDVDQRIESCECPARRQRNW